MTSNSFEIEIENRNGNRKSNALHFYSPFFLAVNLIKIRQDMSDVPKEHTHSYMKRK